MKGRLPQLRDAFFTPPDARGNAPHATREQADQEGRRLNAMRYETVAQAEQALDARARRPLGEVPPQEQSSGLGALLLGGLLLGGLYLLASNKGGSAGDDDDDDDDDADGDGDAFLGAASAPSMPTQQPVTLNVTVSSSSAQPTEPPKVVVTNPEPTPPPKRRRRRLPPAEPATTTTTPVAVPVTPTTTTPEV
jgi:hypothetical protein